MNRPRITVVSEYFLPEEAGSGRFLGELTKELEREVPGADIQVLTSARVYRTSQPGTAPRRECWGRIQIRRLPSFREDGDGFLKRLASDAVFSLWALARASTRRSDCVVLTTNPPLTPMLLRLAAKIHGSRTVYVVHDLFPDVPIALGIWPPRGKLAGLVRRLQRATLKGSDRVVVVGRCMKRHIVSTYGVEPKRVSVVSHWPTLEPVRPGERDAARPAPERQGAFRVLYSGNLGRFQDFDTIMDAAEKLEDEPDIQFEIVGRGARRPTLQRQVESRGLTNVSLRDFAPENEFRNLLLRTDIGLITLEPGMEGLGVPSKIYNLLATAVPVVCIVGSDSEVSQIITEEDCGVRIDHGDSAGLSTAIRELCKQPERHRQLSENALRYIRRADLGRSSKQQFARIVGSVTRGYS